MFERVGKTVVLVGIGPKDVTNAFCGCEENVLVFVLSSHFKVRAFKEAKRDAKF